MPCKDCPNNAYICETGRDLKQRIYEHKRDIRVGNTSSAVFCHVRDFDHVVDFNNCQLVFKSNNYIKRRIVESSLISSTPNFNMSVGQYSFNSIICNQIIKQVKYRRVNPQVTHPRTLRGRGNSGAGNVT